MENQLETPLVHLLKTLPTSVNFELDIKPELEKAGIDKNTFERDCKSVPIFISLQRLKVYARVFNCKIDELVFPKDV